jgi:hypothetical protein
MKISRIFDKQANPQHVVGSLNMEYQESGSRRSISPMRPFSVRGGLSAGTKAEALGTLEEVCVEAHGLFESYKQEVGVSH